MRNKKDALVKMNRVLMYFSKNYLSVKAPPPPPSYHASTVFVKNYAKHSPLLFHSLLLQRLRAWLGYQQPLLNTKY